jgi:dihydroorotate dehydrogenase
MRTLRSAPRRPLLRSTLRPAVRHASTAVKEAEVVGSRVKNFLYGTSLALFATFGYLYITDTRAGVHQWLIVPALRWIYPDAEEAHEQGTKALKFLYTFGLNPRERGQEKKKDLSVTVFGQELLCPIGTSAGIDKAAEIPDALMALGPSIVEVGGCTPLPQEGNPKPRVFRLPSQNALINRYGLNSYGADDMAMRLRERVRLYAYHHGLGLDEEAERMVLDGAVGVPPGSLTEGKMLAVQVAKNKNTPDDNIEAIKNDYVYCVNALGKYADIIVVNVSSPNTPGLRNLQKVEPLTNILKGVVAAAQKTDRKTKPRVMVKVSPDEDTNEQMEGIAEAVWKSGVDGVIVGNTTKRRQGVIPEDTRIPLKEKQILEEQGGLSGPMMFERTLSLVGRYRKLLDQGPPPSAPASNGVTEVIKESAEAAKQTLTGATATEPKVIFATGGITNGKQALQVLNAGASVAMVYTALVYGGSGTISRIKREMREEIKGKQ